jgi:hypothetical protein
MPPFDLTPGQKNLLAHWGAITGAAFEGLGTQETYSYIYAAQVAAEVTPGGFTMADLNPLRSLATGWRRSQEVMAREQSTTSLAGDAVALAPWSRSLYHRNLNPMTEVRYEYIRDTPTGLERNWVTVPPEGLGVLNTVGQVRQAVDEHAAALTEGDASPPLEADESFAGIGNILVLAV